MGILTKIKRANFFKRVGLGLLDVAGLGVIKDNINTPHAKDEQGNPIGTGKIDWLRLATFVLVAGTLLAVIFGKIDIETAKELVKLLK